MTNDNHNNPANISKVAATLLPSQIREIAELGMTMDDVVPLWFGESAWPSPDIAVQAAVSALNSSDHFYQPNSGKPALRDAVEQYYQQIYSLSVPRERICVTGSGMQGVMLTAQALVNAGDRVVVLQPAWPNLGEAFRLMGAEIVSVNLKDVNQQWQLPIEELLDALSPHTRAVVVNSPNNPTGWTMSKSEQQILLEHCRINDIWIVSDDVYSRLYSKADAAPNLLSITHPNDRVISINSFSKAFSMTGWRIGWIVAPPDLESTFAMLTEFNIAGPAAFVQSAAATVLQKCEPDVALLKERLQKAYATTESLLKNTPGVELIQPTGAFYAMLKIKGMQNSFATAKDLLEKNRVGMAPGIAFGQSAEGFLRMCFAQPDEVLTEGLMRFNDYMGKQKDV